LIGYGLAGRVFHAPLIAACPELTLAAVVTRDPGRRAQLGAAHPEAAVLDTPEQLWARASSLELAVIATPNRSHVPLARAALQAGLPVVVDKPFATTAADARALVDEARARQGLLTVFQNRRWAGMARERRCRRGRWSAIRLRRPPDRSGTAAVRAGSHGIRRARPPATGRRSG
jgi:predicted dehydrogenase